MTDKLTPAMLRDLAELCAVGNRVVTLHANGETTRFYPNKDLSYVLLEEAARREAEQLDPVGTASLAASLAQSEDKIAKAAEAALRARLVPTTHADDEALVRNVTLAALHKKHGAPNANKQVNKAEDALRRRLAELRARAAVLAAMTAPGWRDTETDPPPKDQPVLLYCPDRGNPTNRARIELGPYWTSRGSLHAWATYWQPLPAAPEAP